jgi:uracil-DNA glycosylase
MTDASAFFPARITLPSLREAAAGCRACPLYQIGTQTVFGEGPPQARVFMIGEQPGDQEDIEGHPFVGPAGRLLDQALQDAGIVREDAYLSNVVKHFKWIPKGKRRLHQKPNSKEIGACIPWLEQEIELVKPRILVLLGATAAQALMGKQFRVTQQRGEVLETRWRAPALATVHPSSILRQRTPEDRHREMDLFVADLRKVAALLG